MNTPKLAPQMKDLFFLGLLLYKSKGLYQFAIITSTGAIVVPFLDAFKKYLIPNFDNVAIFVILLFLDVGSGIYKHSGIWDKDAPNTLNREAFINKLTRKVFAALVWLTLTNVFEKFTLDNGTPSEWLNTFGISVLISWLTWSISENLHTATKGAFPPIGLIKKLYKNEKTESLTQNPPTNENE
jgi:hypothetical protein